MKNSLFCMAALLLPLLSFSAEYYVDASQSDDSGDGAAWLTAKQTIQAAVDLTSAGDTVWVTNGTYLLSAEVVVTNGIRVCGMDQAQTIVDGGGTVRCFSINSTNESCVLSGLKITNGFSESFGGGVDCAASMHIVSNCFVVNSTAFIGGGMNGGQAYDCVFSGNHAYEGGALHGSAYNCIVSNNTAEFRGGGVTLSEPHHTVESCMIVGNSAENGGGVYSQPSFFNTVSNSVFLRNSADQEGGGACYVHAENCWFFRNQAYEGGGLYVSEAQSCVIFGNKAAVGGGAAFPGGGFLSPWIRNSTVAGNQAFVSDGGIRNGFTADSIIWSNKVGYRFDSYADDTGIYSNCCRADLEHGVDGNVTNAPLLITPGHLASNSPCVGIGVSDHKTDGLDVVIYGDSHCAVGASMDFIPFVRGAVRRTECSFGDGAVVTNEPLLQHSFQVPGVYNVVLTAWNASRPMGVSATQTVHVLSESESAVYVSPAGNNANDGKSWQSAYKTIQAGVDAVVTGGTVWLTNGTYELTSQIDVCKDICIRSLNGPDGSTVDGGGITRCFDLGGWECVINGLTITNGYIGSDVNYEHEEGGSGVYCLNISPMLTNCIIAGNEAGFGGGVCRGTSSDCVFHHNSSEQGGGAVYYGVVQECEVRSNHATMRGGGMLGGYAVNCLFEHNASPGTAGMPPFIPGMGGVGGAMSGGAVLNCTVVNNTARSVGGLDVDIARNCIAWLNSGGNLQAVEVSTSCSPEMTWGLNGNISDNPLFMDAAGGDFRLMSNSPCINWGDNSLISTMIDLDDNMRVVEGCIDLGAYEFQELLSLTDSDGDGILDDWERQYGGNQNPDQVSSNGENTIREAYIAGLDPNDPSSRFLAQVGADQVLRWNATSGRVYSVWCSTNLMSGFQCLETNIPWTVDGFTGTVQTASEQLFYKIDVQLDD